MRVKDPNSLQGNISVDQRNGGGGRKPERLKVSRLKTRLPGKFGDPVDLSRNFCDQGGVRLLIEH